MKPLLILFFLLAPLSAQSLYWQRVGSDFTFPVEMKAIGGGQFIVLEKPGRLILTDFNGNRGEILDWQNQVQSRGKEQGFLSIALAPDFSSSGRAYFNLINKKGFTEIWRYTFNPQKLSEARKPAELLLSFNQPYRNHNGGWLDFGPDGMLYIAVGDGGAANDPKNYAQNLDSYLGKILRIDVSGNTGYTTPKDNPNLSPSKPEIYAYGLRNPWRCYWQGDQLIIADVGQSAHEEINVVSKAKLRGANFGWRLREGLIATPKNKVGGERPSNSIQPVLTYPHQLQEPLSGISITGGVTYSGSIASLKGYYFFADYGVPKVWATKINETSSQGLKHLSPEAKPDAGLINNITSFAKDTAGEIYIICQHGDIFKLRSK